MYKYMDISTHMKSAGVHDCKLLKCLKKLTAKACSDSQACRLLPAFHYVDEKTGSVYCHFGIIEHLCKALGVEYPLAAVLHRYQEAVAYAMEQGKTKTPDRTLCRDLHNLCMALLHKQDQRSLMIKGVLEIERDLISAEVQA